MSDAPPLTPAVSERMTLLWRLWVAPERERAARPPRRTVTTWGSRERRIRGRVRVVG